jgi:uncharacterized protein (DUF2141 family)
MRMNREVAAVAVWFALSIGLVGQAPRDAGGSGPDQASGVIAGMVTSSAGAPLARTQVILSSTASRTAITDDRGAFVFTNLPPDEYTLSASRVGYLDVVWGQRNPGSGRPGTPISLAQGQRLAPITLQMPRGGVITGVVVDDNGEPAIGVPVRAYRWTLRRGEPALVSASFDQTDDRGIYRIPFLPAGNYIVAASPRTELDAIRLAEALSAPSPVSYAPVFHPGTPLASEAALVSIGIGEERASVDIQLQRLTNGRISGTVISPSGAPQPGAKVTLSDVPQGLPQQGARSVQTGSRGQFAFDDVPPGPHALTARTEGGAALWGRADVADSRDADVVISLRRGISVTGTVTFDSASPVSAPTGIRLSLVGMGPGAVGESPTALVQPNTAFTLRNVPPGRYQLVADSLPSGHALASAVFGGLDVLDSFLDVKPGEDLAGVVTVSSRVTELAGSLLDSDGRTLSDYTILAFAAETQYWAARSRRIRTTRPATNGRFVFQGLPPGEYRLVAVADAEPGEEFDPDFLRQLSGDAVRVTLAEGERQAHDLRVKSR